MRAVASHAGTGFNLSIGRLLVFCSQIFCPIFLQTNMESIEKSSTKDSSLKFFISHMCLNYSWRIWFGISGDGDSGSLKYSTVSGWLFMIASVSQISVWKDSPSKVVAFFSNRADNTLQIVLIWHSHTLPAWLADGGFILKVIQLQFSFSNPALILFWSIDCKASWNSHLAPMKFVPWSLCSWQTGTLLQMKRRKALRNKSVSKVFETTRCTARDTMHVKRATYRIYSPISRAIFPTN